MKKFLTLILALAMTMSLAACGGEESAPEEGGAAEGAEMRVAMITDQSFNQTSYEACMAYCDANGVDFSYFKPAGDNTADRVAMIEKAVDEGYNVMVLPGFAFGATIAEVQDEYPDIKFVGLDVSQFDVEDCFYNHDETGARTELIDPENEPHIGDNVYCAVYQEELSGYMAGYAAVKLGYKHLGFLGGMAVPAVIRFGYGFVQGVNDAAVELGIADEVSLEYVYGNQFFGDADITAYMDNWYQTLGVEVVFACGGGIYTSAAEAAAKTENGKLIGVDVDQSGNLSTYGEDLCVTSAMKGLAPTVEHMLTEIAAGNFANYGGKVESLGMISGDDATVNYVQLPLETTQWSDTFTEDDYLALVKDMFDGTITVSADISAMPQTSITVNDMGTIK